MISLYNSLSRAIEPFKAIEPPTVKIYACGPTVYNQIHIGNFRTYIAEDVLRRVLEQFGFSVELVMNITDVGHLTSDADEGEDKLEKAAREKGESAQLIAKRYTEQFVTDAERLGILSPTKLVKATDHIAQQIELIRRIEEKGFTYRLSDGLYFDTSKLKNYGRFSPHAADHQQARVAEKGKRQVADFALWRITAIEEARQQEWDSPWGRGFPGWHIECSAMATKYLGEEFDIHCGGVDHLSIHHENEIAQNEAAFGRLMARYWFHVNFLVVDGEKMARSRGGFYSLDDLITEGIEPLAFRLLVLHHHYRSLVEFSLDRAREAQKELNAIRLLLQRESGKRDQKTKDELLGTVSDDLGLPRLLDGLHQANNPWLWLEFEPILGLGLTESAVPLTVEETALVAQREEFRKNGDFTAADSTRDQLKDKGIVIEDSSDGPRAFRIPKQPAK